jgi:hypothetical protein
MEENSSLLLQGKNQCHVQYGLCRTYSLNANILLDKIQCIGHIYFSGQTRVFGFFDYFPSSTKNTLPARGLEELFHAVLDTFLQPMLHGCSARI